MKNYNEMCKNCTRLGNDCKGSTNEIYSGCIYKVESKKEETIMTKSQFAQAVAKEVNGVVERVEKANGIVFTGIIVNSDSDIRPCVYIDQFYEDELSVEETAEEVRKASANASTVFSGVEWIRDWESVKSHLRARLYNERTSADVQRPAGRGMDDLIIVPYITDVLSDSDKMGAVKVTNALLREWNVTADEVLDMAEKNSADDVKIRSLSEMLAELMGAPDMSAGDDEPLVVTNRDGVYGAYAVLAGYDALKERFPEGFTVLPSSVHEVLVIGAYEDGFNGMVNEVNDSVVSPEEVLGTRAYKVA